MHCFIMKIPDKDSFKKIAFNHFSDIEIQDFMNIYKKM